MAVISKIDNATFTVSEQGGQSFTFNDADGWATEVKKVKVMTNFYEETVDIMKRYDKNSGDVVFVGSRDGQYRCSWAKFVAMADFSYDDGFGAAHIALDLVIVFDDQSWLNRTEYDGSEKWSFNRCPAVDDEKVDKIGVLGGDQYMWKNLDEMNNFEKYDEEGYEK